MINDLNFSPVDLNEKYFEHRVEDPESQFLASEIHFFGRGQNSLSLGALLAQVGPQSTVIYSYSDDRGVLRNGGRVGAALAPQAIREQLYKFQSLGASKSPIIDLGDFDSWGYPLEEAQNRAKDFMELLRKTGARVILLGGGHDWAYSDFSGTQSDLLINFDAHLDVRPQPEEDSSKNHSGTPFRRILEERNRLRLYQVGIQKKALSQIHLQWLKAYQASIFYSEDLLQADSEGWKYFWEKYEADQVKSVDVSLDLDVFRQDACPGVSAPSVFALDPLVFFGVWKKLLPQIKNLAFYELNPLYDRDSQSARLVAELVYSALSRDC